MDARVLSGQLQRSSIGWTVGTFARPRVRSASERSEYRGTAPRGASPGGGERPPTKSERAKVPLPLHRSDEPPGYSRGSRDFVALQATCLRPPRRSTQLQSAITSGT